MPRRMDPEDRELIRMAILQVATLIAPALGLFAAAAIALFGSTP